MSRRTRWAMRAYIAVVRALVLLGGTDFVARIGYSLVEGSVEAMQRKDWHIVRFDPATEAQERPLVTEEWPRVEPIR